ncbi:MAG: ArgE/DapE family deacylase [Actinobacteria bacterium]|nr:ArgE/DapE family deacylase [Actinomycetota bacterium]
MTTHLPDTAGPLTDLERRVLAAVDEAAVVARAVELLAVPSLSGLETPAQELAAEQLARAGMTVDTWDIDVAALSTHRYFSAEVERPDALGVLGWYGAGDGPSLLLNGHTDVVPTGDANDWTSAPFEPTVRDGRLFGRGACDMKGGLAAAIHAVEAIRDAGVELAGRVGISPVVGEEDGGTGSLAVIERGERIDGCIIMEPTRLDVVPANAGALSWRITVRGWSAHGCLREEGVSALEKFAPVHRAVLDLERERNSRDVDPLFAWLDTPFAICGGRIAGGDWPSSEMDWLTWEGRYGVAPGEDLARARGELEAAVAAVCAGDPWLRDHPATVEWWGGQFIPGATHPGDPVVTTVLGSATDVLGRRPELRGMPYGCDLGLFRNAASIPTVVYGPGDVRDAHRPDEFVPVDELVATARTLALAALRFCGVA